MHVAVCACRKLFCRHHVDVFAISGLHGARSQLPSPFTGHARNAALGNTVLNFFLFVYLKHITDVDAKVNSTISIITQKNKHKTMQ